MHTVVTPTDKERDGTKPISSRPQSKRHVGSKHTEATPVARARCVHVHDTTSPIINLRGFPCRMPFRLLVGHTRFTKWQ